MQSLTTDLEGIIRELSISEGEVLYPFYEAVVNSIQAIDERINCSNPRVSVYIERDKSEQNLFERYDSFPISSIRIVDNGIGFTENNYDSFSKAHSTKKVKIGGKGLGRFTMLSVFQKMKIDSVRESNENNKISFSLSRKEGLSDPVISTTKNPVCTTIILSELTPKFRKATAKFSHEEIADNILSHCLLYYLRRNAPIIEVIEDTDVINLSNQFSPSEYIQHHVKKQIGDTEFDLYFIRSNKISAHKYCLCGHNRKVKEKKIETIFPLFSSKIFESENNSYYIHLYVVSSYLDNIVNTARNEFNFPKNRNDEMMEKEINFGDIDSPNTIYEKNIEDLIVNVLEETYKNEVEERRSIVKLKVSRYLCSDEGLEYRHLNPDNDFYDSITDNVDEKKLDTILHTYQYKRSRENREKRDKLFSKNYSNKKDYQALLKEVIDMTTCEGHSKLAQYVAHRKTIISLLEKYMEWSEDNDNYNEESTLHNLIYIMGGNQDTIAYDKHNLWLLDDRLTFHRYIYSDKQIKSHTPMENLSDCLKETDIAIYDKTFYYGERNDYDEINSIVIFELKRPSRILTYEEFSKQMREQIIGIKGGKLSDYKRKYVPTSDNVPIFFYYICDTNAYEKLKESATMEGFSETPYKSLIRLTNKNVHQEIFTYQTLIINAKRRNKIFFKKLGIE